MKRFLPILMTVCALLASCAEEEVAMFGSLSGLVKNAETGAPISGVRATLTPGGLSILTGTDGTFSFSNLDPADYTVSFAADGYEPVEQRSSVKPGVDATVQVVMIPVKPVLAVSTNVLEFGKENTTLSVDISNSGKGTLEWSVSEDISWLTAVPVSGKITSEKATVVFTVSRDGLENGSHTKSLVIASNGGSQTLVATLEVDVLNMTVTPAELDFGTVESTLQLTLKNTGTGSVRYNVRSDNSWCAPNKTSGTVSTTDYLNVVVSRGDLAAGKYNTTVYISTNGGELTVPVKMEVVERQMPTVTLESVEGITYNAATAKGTLLSVGSEAVTRYGVCYATNDSPTVSDKVLNLGDAKKAQSFQSAMTGLQSETTYYVRAFAENSVGLSYSERTVRFTTMGLPTVPTVETGSVEDITSTTAKARGTVSSLGNVEKVTAYGHVWGLTPSPTVSSNAGKSNKGETMNTLSFVSDLASLKVNTTYYVRAYATNSKGTSYGDEISFTTEKGDVALTTDAATEIIHNAATVGGTITSDGGNTIIEAGVCYGVSSSLSISGDHIVATIDGNSFSGRLTGLATETNYYIKAYAKTDNGKVFYGNNKQFTTTKEVKLPTLGAVSVTNIKTDGATLSSRTSNNGNSAILENGFCWSEYGTPTVDNEKISCAVSTNFGTTISGLTDGTTYHVRSWARNAMGIAYSDVVTFKTVAITAPELSVPQILNVNMEWATAIATVLSTGNAKLEDSGFCISTSPEPTVYDDKYSLGKVTDLQVKFENLQKSTTYYVRAYAENTAGIGYSTEVSFTTAESDPTVWDGKSVATSFAGGAGSSSDPVRISTAAQLKLFANNIKAGNVYKNIEFMLTTDIDWNGNDWDVGDDSNDFRGVFNGNGHIISNINAAAGPYIWSGSFLCETFGCSIKNLALSGNCSFSGNTYGIKIINSITYCNRAFVDNATTDFSHIYNSVFAGLTAPYAFYKDWTGGRSYQKSEHSFWLFDVASNVGTQYTDDSKGNYSQDCYSFTRTSTQCLIAPSYTDDLVQELNTWVNKNNDSEYGHLCKWTYEYVDGYARPKLIPED
ncbi:MAG: carboxypeptidase regulatory-like domain-containing protein [Bacteroidales bacterium]|nr:carboxypeptidase regulatory-like domain-containing protein [Bacteroidales bacterium]